MEYVPDILEQYFLIWEQVYKRKEHAYIRRDGRAADKVIFGGCFAPNINITIINITVFILYA